jgi:hypothetical protein
MSNDCHIYWWEFNYLKSIKSRIFKEWSHLKGLFLSSIFLTLQCGWPCDLEKVVNVRFTGHASSRMQRLAVGCLTSSGKYFMHSVVMTIIDLCVIDSYIKDAFLKYVILHQNCVYTALSIAHVSIKLSLIIIIIV